MAVIQMSERELSRLRVMIDLADGRLTVEAAGTLMGVGRRQVFRLCRAFAAAGASGLVSRKRGRPSNRRRGAAFRDTTLALIREPKCGLICVRRWRPKPELRMRRLNPLKQKPKLP